MDFFNSISMLLGYCVIGVIIIIITTMIWTLLETKIKDTKSSKTIIRVGTVMYLDGKQMEIKKDLKR